MHGGRYLNKELVTRARRLEIEYFQKMQVYEKVPRWKARGKKVITTRWVDTDKGDENQPDYRSRLVGREIK